MKRTEGRQQEGVLKTNHPGTLEEVRPQPKAYTHCLGLQQPFPRHSTSVSLFSQHSRLVSGKRPDLGNKGPRLALPGTIGSVPAGIAGPRFRASGTGPEPRAWSCPAPRGGACAPRPAPAASARPVSATAARRARHVAGAARPPGSGLRRGAGREDGRTDRRTLVDIVRRGAGGPGTDGQAHRGMGAPEVSVSKPGWARWPGLRDSGGLRSSLATAAEPPRGP